MPSGFSSQSLSSFRCYDSLFSCTFDLSILQSCESLEHSLCGTLTLLGFANSFVKSFVDFVFHFLFCEHFYQHLYQLHSPHINGICSPAGWFNFIRCAQNSSTLICFTVSELAIYDVAVEPFSGLYVDTFKGTFQALFSSCSSASPFPPSSFCELLTFHSTL